MCIRSTCNFVQSETARWRHMSVKVSQLNSRSNVCSRKVSMLHIAGVLWRESTDEINPVVSSYNLPPSCGIGVSLNENVLTFWWHRRLMLPRKLSCWGLPVQPVMEISLKWHLRFSNRGENSTRKLASETVGLPFLWRHNGRGSVSNHQPHDCLLNHLFRRRSKKTSKLRVTGLCAGNSPGTGEFPAQMASYAENVSIWWRHHALHMASSPTIELFSRHLIFAVGNFIPHLLI